MPLTPLGLPNVSFSASASLGLLLPFGGLSAAAVAPPQPLLPPPGVSIGDRFFLGGPNSFWGFRSHGVGPREQRMSAQGLVNSKTPSDALGGEV